MTNPAMPQDAEVLTVDSPVLGPLTLDPAELYTFPIGLVGLERYHRYALVESGRPGVWWLQSVDEPSLVFVLADPFQHVASYDVDVADAELAHIGPASADQLLVLAVVTLPRGAGAVATANLRAPVVLNVATRRGRQVVLTDERYSVATPIAL
jgi:flagellar assembly factor FliW